MIELDKRLNAFRSDLADAKLRGKLECKAFVEPELGQIDVPVADLLSAPDAHSGIQAQALLGELVDVFEVGSDFAWVQRKTDGYVGYIATNHLSRTVRSATHVVAAPRTFRYSKPDLKSPPVDALSMGSHLNVVGEQEVRGTLYSELIDGRFVISHHIREISNSCLDFVVVAERLLRTPYLWGGNSAFGLDCSGLVQLSMSMAGTPSLRDTDMQFQSFSDTVSQASDLWRGDLVFWDGHVGIMSDHKTLLHANGHTMDVSQEPLQQAIDRIGYLYEQPIGFRRPNARALS
ncbi:MAG: NlpC/P60 family protein [Pseudomonadota bacterium]